MEKSFGVLIHLKKPRAYSDGKTPIYLRITVDTVCCEISTKRKCSPLIWNAAAERANPRVAEGKALNQNLDTLQQKVFEAKRKLIEEDKEVTAESIKSLMLGKEKRTKHFILQIFKHHNEQMEALVSKTYNQRIMK